MRTAQRRNEIGIEMGIFFEMPAQIVAGLDLVEIMEQQARPEGVKPLRQISQANPVARDAHREGRAVGRVDGGDYRLRGSGISLRRFIELVISLLAR